MCNTSGVYSRIPTIQVHRQNRQISCVGAAYAAGAPAAGGRSQQQGRECTLLALRICRQVKSRYLFGKGGGCSVKNSRSLTPPQKEGAQERTTRGEREQGRERSKRLRGSVRVCDFVEKRELDLVCEAVCLRTSSPVSENMFSNQLKGTLLEGLSICCRAREGHRRPDVPSWT